MYELAGNILFELIFTLCLDSLCFLNYHFFKFTNLHLNKLIADVLQLADVCEEFREVSKRIYDLGPIY